MLSTGRMRGKLLNSRSHGSEHVLVVDDEPVILSDLARVVRRVLDGAGELVETA